MCECVCVKDVGKKRGKKVGNISESLASFRPFEHQGVQKLDIFKNQKKNQKPKNTNYNIFEN